MNSLILPLLGAAALLAITGCGGSSAMSASSAQTTGTGASRQTCDVGAIEAGLQGIEAGIIGSRENFLDALAGRRTKEVSGARSARLRLRPIGLQTLEAMQGTVEHVRKEIASC